MTRSTNHSIKQVALAKEEVKSGQEEPFLFQAEMEEELSEEVQIHETAKEVTGKPTMGVTENPLFVRELIEAPGGKVAEEEVTQEVFDENQTDLDQPVVFRSSIQPATRVIPAKLTVGPKARILRNLMFGSHETEFKEPENYLSQGRPPKGVYYFRDGLPVRDEQA